MLRGIDITNENHYHLCMQPPRKPDSANRNPSSAQPNAGRTPQSVTSEQLLGEARELVIVHAGREYRLRLTQYGKLILTA